MIGRKQWEPPVGRTSAMADYLAERGLASYEDLWQWSVDDIDGFWASMWARFGFQGGYAAVRTGAMPDVTWFPGARLNYAERALAGDGLAVVARSQTRGSIELTWDDLRDLVSRCRAGLQRLGVESGDRVVGYLPNAPEALIAFLATASLGAIWAACPPEFGVRSVLDRFEQLDPKVLIAVAGYRYGPRAIDRSAEVAAIREALPGATVVGVPYLGDVPDCTSWEDLMAEPADIAFAPVPFDHPLYVLFSSGTTGPPKAST
jgi:acetoacetyl-CoA synthetase